jgi:type III secretion protein S
MLPASTLTAYGEQALLLAAALSLPIVGVAALVGLLVAGLQAASQVQDPTLAHLPRLVAVMGALALLAPWMGGQLAAFAERVLSLPM